MDFNFGAVPQLLINGLLTGSFYALLSVSIGIIYATTQTFHFAHALSFTLAAYMAFLMAESGMPFLIILTAPALIAAGFGYLVDRVMYAPLRSRGAANLNIFLASLGLLVCGEALIHIIFGPNSQIITGFQEDYIIIGEIAFTSLDVFMAVLSWVLVVLVKLLLTKTRLGSATRAVSNNEGLAQMLGINVVNIYALVFILGSLLAGVAGVLYGLKNTASPGLGLSLVVTSFIGMFIGGVGNFMGAALGGLILGIFENVGAIFLPGYVHTIVSFGLLVAILIWRPTGLFGRNVDLARG